MRNSKKLSILYLLQVFLTIFLFSCSINHKHQHEEVRPKRVYPKTEFPRENLEAYIANANLDPIEGKWLETLKVNGVTNYYRKRHFIPTSNRDNYQFFIVKSDLFTSDKYLLIFDKIIGDSANNLNLMYGTIFAETTPYFVSNNHYNFHFYGSFSELGGQSRAIMKLEKNMITGKRIDEYREPGNTFKVKFEADYTFRRSED